MNKKERDEELRQLRFSVSVLSDSILSYDQALEDALKWIRSVSEELVDAGGKPGDRTVALANLREFIGKYRAAIKK